MSKLKVNKFTLIHVAVWAVMFLSPLMFLHPGEKLSVVRYLYRLPWPLSLFIVFYANYFFLASDLNKGKRLKYFAVNIVMIVVLAIGGSKWNSYVWRHNHVGPEKEMIWKKKGEMMRARFNALMTLRDMFSFAVAAALATSVIYARKLTETEKARQEAENARAEAELSNLRSQVNPHFLLNTLNNIYALTAFDQQKAQTAIMELSKMLRHVLYDNQQRLVNVADEVGFIHNYVNLMKLRVTGRVDIQENYDVPDPCTVFVAPMIFISLVENAFKHGISPTEPSFIHISISANSSRIVCQIVNSNYPKSPKDRSGHGIGLQQVRRRLELAYPGRYDWEVKVNENNEYSSKITIYDTQLHNNR